MHIISSVLIASVLSLGLVGITSVQAQTFDITTQQEGQGEAVITVQLATNNTVVIPPNGTIIEVPGNITQVDNDTVVITPDNETVTPLPGNVTVITPPEPEPCGCPPANVTEEQGPLAPVVVRPAPGQEVIAENGTELVANESQEEPIPIPPEPEPAPAPENETAGPTTPVETPTNDTGSGTGSGEGNDTGLAPASLIAQLPWWEA